MPKQNDLEQKALQLIMSSGDKGLLQSDLWRKLGASSREGSRIALKLESKGLIRREKELCDGRWTYRLYPKKMPTSIDSIIDCPCTFCTDEQKCGPVGVITPQHCEKLTMWILKVAEEDCEKMGEN